MQGKIVKGIAGFYYVNVPNFGIYECKAKGIFRKQQVKPLVGENVEIEILDEAEKKGNIEAILPRKNALIRPAVANIDQALIVFAVKSPKPNLNLLDRFLVMMEKERILAAICFNKTDLASDTEIETLKQIYEGSGYPLYFLSAFKETVPDCLGTLLLGKTTAVAGPSGVGKSTLINALHGQTVMETGSISEKIKRGKHTTRHSELICLQNESYVMDTPGFTSFSIDEIAPESMQEYFPEFSGLEKECRFCGCAHIHEPDCAVKRALAEGKISKERYEHYVMFYEEAREKRRY